MFDRDGGLKRSARAANCTVSHVLLEYCCSVCSEIGKQAPDFGVACVRLTIHDQLQTRAGHQRLLRLVEPLSKLPITVDIHGATPCTVWSTLQNVNTGRLGPSFRPTSRDPPPPGGWALANIFQTSYG